MKDKAVQCCVILLFVMKDKAVQCCVILLVMKDKAVQCCVMKDCNTICNER